MESQHNFESIIRENFPTEGWLKDFIQFGRKVTDAPPEYHLFAGMTIYGMALGRNISLPWGNRSLYPNFFCLLTGRSTTPRKSTSSQIGMDILMKVLPDHISPDRFTPEAFSDSLMSEPNQLIYIDEFGDFLRSMDRKDYMAGLKGDFTKLYDCPPLYVFKTIGGGSKRVEEPFVSIIGISTLAWLKDKLNERDFSAGFWARWLIIPEFPKETWFAIPPSPDLELKEKLIAGLQKASEKKGEVSLSDDAKRLYTEWLRNHENSIMNDLNQDKLDSMYGRLGVYVLKIAMVYEVSRGSMEIGQDSIQRAINIIDCLKEKMKGIIETEFTFSPAMQNKQKVQSIIMKRPGITNRELLRASKMLLKDLKPITETLIEEESIEQKGKGRSTCYSPKQLSPLSPTVTIA